MSSWQGVSRTNFVKFSDLDGLKKAIEPFAIKLSQNSSAPEYWMLEGDDPDHGGFPTSAWPDDADEAIEFDFAEHVAPYLAPGEVLITMESGHDKLRYLTGHTSAYTFDGHNVRQAHLDLNDIYSMAAKEFGVELNTIAPASYESLSPVAEEQIKARQQRPQA